MNSAGSQKDTAREKDELDDALSDLRIDESAAARSTPTGGWGPKAQVENVLDDARKINQADARQSTGARRALGVLARTSTTWRCYGLKPLAVNRTDVVWTAVGIDNVSELSEGPLWAPPNHACNRPTSTMIRDVADLNDVLLDFRSRRRTEVTRLSRDRQPLPRRQLLLMPEAQRII